MKNKLFWMKEINAKNYLPLKSIPSEILDKDYWRRFVPATIQKKRIHENLYPKKFLPLRYSSKEVNT